MVASDEEILEKPDPISQAEQSLIRLLSKELSEVIEILGNSRGFENKYLVTIPDTNSVDLPLGEILALVAQASNSYGRLSRLTGIAKAQAKLQKGRYERAYKKARIGKNDAERDQNAMKASESEHRQLAFTESLVDLAVGFENAARVASESARKIATSIQDQYKAQMREESGHHNESSFRG